MKTNSSRRRAEEIAEAAFVLFESEMISELRALEQQAQSMGLTLDYSERSLDDVEKFLAAQGKDADAVTARDRAARYLGEVFRLELGGQWQLSKRGPRYLGDLLPVIGGFSDRDYDILPLALVNNFLVGTSWGVLRKALAANIPFRRTESGRNQIRNPCA